MDPQTIAADPATTMDTLLTQWPVIGIAAVYLIDKFLARLKSKGIDLVMMGKQLNALTDDVLTMKGQVKDLYEWHNVRDEDGVKIWYSSKRILEKGLEKLEEQLGRIKTTLDKIDRRTT